MDKTTQVANNLQWLMTKARTNPHELQRATGVPQPTIHRILTGVSTDPRTQTLEPLARFFQVSVSDLRDRDLAVDDYFGQGTVSKRVVVPEGDDPGLSRIPKVKLRLAEGTKSFEAEPEDHDGQTTTVPTSWIDRKALRRDQLLAVLVSDESMEPTLFAGDVAVINLDDTGLVDGVVYAMNYEGRLIIRRLERDAGEWWLKSDNLDQRKHGRKVFRPETCIVIGRVVRKESERL